jgi:hypothetical protein
MPVAKITGQGLAVMAVSVALLWTCIIAERVSASRAMAERTRVMREVRRTRDGQRPVYQPRHLIQTAPRLTAG